MSILANKEMVAQRIQFCSSCEYKKHIMLIPRCQKCGCPIATKVMFESAKCPVEKW